MATLVGLILAGATALPGLAYQRPAEYSLLTLKPDGTQAPEDGKRSLHSTISADGRWVAFATSKPLLSSDGNDFSDIYLYERRTGKLQLISTTPIGIAPDATAADELAASLCYTGSAGEDTAVSYDPSISSTGRFTAFTSSAPNLVPGDTNILSDVFVYDRKTATMEIVSVSSDGIVGDLASSWPSISADGKTVSFTSCATNLVAEDRPSGIINPTPNVFVRDRSAHTTLLVSATLDGKRIEKDLSCALCDVGVISSISGNGRFVAFDSEAKNLVTNDSNETYDVFIHDLETRETERASLSSHGAEATDPAAHTDPWRGYAGNTLTGSGVHLLPASHSISNDGRFVVFASRSADLVPNDTNRHTLYSESCAPAGTLCSLDIFVKDQETGRIDRVNVSSSGAEAASSAGPYSSEYHSPSISADGRYVTFSHTNCSDINKFHYITDTSWSSLCFPWANSYIYDRRTGELELIVRGAEVQTDPCISQATDPSIDGRYVALATQCNLSVPDVPANAPVSSDFSTSGWDFYLRDRGLALGAGTAAAVRLSGSENFADLRLASSSDAIDDVSQLLTETGVNLSGASIIHRPQLRDLFFRLQLEKMPAVAARSAPRAQAILYGADFKANGEAYQLRAMNLASADFDIGGGGSFGLFRRAETGLYGRVGPLHGGYGTTGEEIVVSVPLALLGLEQGGEVANVEAFTAFGSYITGPIQILDRANVE